MHLRTFFTLEHEGLLKVEGFYKGRFLYWKSTNKSPLGSKGFLDCPKHVSAHVRPLPRLSFIAQRFLEENDLTGTEDRSISTAVMNAEVTAITVERLTEEVKKSSGGHGSVGHEGLFVVFDREF